MFAADEAVHCVAQGEWIWRSKQSCGVAFAVNTAAAAAVAFVAAVFHAGAAAAFEAAVILGVDLNSSQASNYGNKRRENGDTSKSHVFESDLHRIHFVASLNGLNTIGTTR